MSHNNSNDLYQVTTENNNARYSVGASIIPYVSGSTDLVSIIGSPNKTIRVKRIQVSGYAGTPTTIPVSLIRRNTPNVSGSYYFLPPVKCDILNDFGFIPSITSASTTTISALNQFQVGNITSFSNTGSLTGVTLNTTYYVTTASNIAFSISTSSVSTGSFLTLGGTSGTASLVGQASAVVQYYTTNPTLGNSAGIIRQQMIPFPTTGSNIYPIIWQWGDKNDKALILRGTSDLICINLGATPITGGLINFDIDWEEDNS